jgi:hypothetical protein
MNGDTMEAAIECAKEAGAIVKCPKCSGHDISVADDVAVRRAYALAKRAVKNNEPGFRGLSPDEVRGVIDSVLEDTPGECFRFPS